MYIDIDIDIDIDWYMSSWWLGVAALPAAILFVAPVRSLSQTQVH